MPRALSGSMTRVLSDSASVRELARELLSTALPMDLAGLVSAPVTPSHEATKGDISK